MTRFRAFAALAAIVLAMGLSASAAGAQDATSTTSTTAPDYPGTTAPAICTGSISASAPLLANTSVVIRVACNTLINGEALDGVLNSTPVQLGASTVSDHAVSYSVTLPGDWNTNATHSVTLRSVETDALRASVKFYVNGSGKITAAPTTATSLARTGSSSHTGDFVKSGVVLLAVGAVALRMSRKRRHADAAA